MRFPHTVTSDLYEGPDWVGKISPWAGVGVSYWEATGRAGDIAVTVQSGFGAGALVWFPAGQIDELLSLFTDLKERIEGPSEYDHSENDE